MPNIHGTNVPFLQILQNLRKNVHYKSEFPLIARDLLTCNLENQHEVG